MIKISSGDLAVYAVMDGVNPIIITEKLCEGKRVCDLYNALAKAYDELKMGSVKTLSEF